MITTRRWGAVAGVTVLFFTVGLFYSSRLSREDRGPVTRPNPGARPPVVDTIRGVRHVAVPEPAERLVPDTLVPDRRDVALLWLQGRPAVTGPDGRVALDPGGAPLAFDGRLVGYRLPWRLKGHQPASLAADGSGGYWVATRTGAILRVGADGVIADSATTPFDYAWMAGGPAGVWAFRSPEQFAFPFGRSAPPLLAAVAGTAPTVPARSSTNPLFEHLVNAGRVLAMDDGGFVYAPFIRDEIVRFTAAGDTVWVASRGYAHGVDEPSIEIGPDGPLLDYAPVNLGLRRGPDGKLYALSTPGQTVERARLDRIDPASGRIEASTEVPALPTLAVDPDGRVYLLDAFRLLTGTAPAEREPLTPFDLATLDGDRARLADYHGRVLLVNFWASWCAPCRQEMPELDTLRQEFAEERLAFLAISDDIQAADARAFIDELGFTFPVALGRGKMRNQYHYFGLPFTALVDAEGRVIQRWQGYGGEPQIQGIRAAIRAELDRTAPDGQHLHAGH